MESSTHLRRNSFQDIGLQQALADPRYFEITIIGSPRAESCFMASRMPDRKINYDQFNMYSSDLLQLMTPSRSRKMAGLGTAILSSDRHILE